MFLQMGLRFLENGIESLHFSISLSENIREISMLCNVTEQFMIFIPVLQCKLSGVVYEIFTLITQVEYQNHKH